MVPQPGVGVVLAYVEGVRDGARMVSALRAAHDAQKPVVMMKVGRSSVGALAAHSHTASPAGADEVYDAVFRQFGVHRARRRRSRSTSPMPAGEASIRGRAVSLW